MEDLRRGRPSWGLASLMQPAGGRARRNVRVFAAMLRTERITRQLTRPSDPVESCATSAFARAYEKNLGPMISNVKKRRNVNFVAGSSAWLGLLKSVPATVE